MEKIVEELKKHNEFLTKNCSTTVMIKAQSYGGSLNNLEVPAITQGKLYRQNKELALALTMQIAIAKANNLEFVIDFCFTDEQIYNYKQQK